MMRRTVYLCAGFQQYATYHFELRATGVMKLEDRFGHQKTLILDERRNESCKFPNWEVAVRYCNQTCELTLRYNAWTRTLPVPAQYERAASQLPPGFLEIRFQAESVDVKSRIDGGPEWTAENVRSLEIAPNQKITVVSDSELTFRPVSESSRTEEPSPPFPKPTFRPVPEPSRTGEPPPPFPKPTFRPVSKSSRTGEPPPPFPEPTFRPVSEPPRTEAAQVPSPFRLPLSPRAVSEGFFHTQSNDWQEESGGETPPSAPQPETPSAPSAPDTAEEMEQLRQELELAHNERNQAREDFTRMRKQFEQEQRRNERLQTSLSGNLERLAERLDSDLESLNAALQEKTRAVEMRTEELKSLSQDVETLDSNLQSIETQLQELKRVKEIRCMNCQQAREDLETLRTRYQDNDNSLALLVENASPLLRNSTLMDTMNRIGEELDAAEQQLGRIIRWREAVNGNIQRTVLEGNGLLNLNSELQG